MYKRNCLLLSLLGVAAIIWLLLKTENSAVVQSPVVINEVCSTNMRIFKDSDYDGSDYIELYNRSEEEICLGGWYLSDDESDRLKYALPEDNLAPGEYMMLYSEGFGDGPIFPFGIRYSGEKLFLSDEEGNTIDSVMVPQLSVDETYARTEDGAAEWEIKSATPGESNASGEIIVQPTLRQPVFSEKTGFYEEAFYLTLKAGKNETIYYTLDGSIPDESDLVYTEPLLIENVSSEPNRYVSQLKVVERWHHYEPDPTLVDKANVVRAIAVNEQGEISEVVTETYFVGLPEYEEMSVMSLTVEPEELFGDDGIFVTGHAYDWWYDGDREGTAPEMNFMKRGKAWEVATDMKMLEKGDLVADQTVGMRAQGNSGRKQILKRISLFAREEYSGSDYFNESFLGKEKVHSVMINEYISNVALPRLVEDRAVGIQKSRVEPIAVFINGEYWYTRYMMEKYNRQYLDGTYGVDPDNVIIFKNNTVHTGDYLHEGYFRQIQEVALDPSMTPDEKYDLLCQLIDMQSFIDFFSINAYLCNMNMNEQENYVLWRTMWPEEGNPYGDVRWRWLIYDLECIESLRLEYYEVEERAAINSFSYPMDFIFTTMNENSIFKGLKECERFKDQFITSFIEIATVNFAPERVEALLAEYDLGLDWLEGYFVKRTAYMLEYLAEEFGLENLDAYLTNE